jgi:hypothetical protein
MAEEIVKVPQLDIQLIPASIQTNLVEVEAFVRESVKHYEGYQMGEGEYKLAKGLRANLNGMSKEFNARRIAMKKEYMKPWDALEAELKRIDGIITSEAAAIDAQVKQADEEFKVNRRAALIEAYEEFCPVLVPVVPFERILQPEWLNRSVNLKKAEGELQEKAAKLAADWDSFNALDLKHKEQAEIVFFQTFDLAAAINEDKRITEERARIDALRAEVLPEPPEPPTEPVIDVEPVNTPEPEEMATEGTVAPQRATYYIELEATEAELKVLVGFLKAHGIHGKVMKNG